MNLLMVTRRVDIDDERVGFVHRLIERLAERVDELGVICLECGRIELPARVRVFSMGKEKGNRRFTEFMNYQRALAAMLPRAEVIFGHMNPIYTILAAPWSKLMRRKLVMWYAHGSVSHRLRLAHFLADEVATSTPEGFRLPSRKLRIIGQCIDTQLFHPAAERRPQERINLLSLGRLSPVKNVECILQAMYILIHKWNISHVHLQIAGSPATPEQADYSRMLQDMVTELGLNERVSFIGPVNYRKTVDFYQSAHIFINQSNTGSLDKAILEAMACGCLPLSCNQAYVAWTTGHHLRMLNTHDNNPQTLADGITRLIKLEPDKRRALEMRVRQLVVDEHNMEVFLDRLLGVFKNG